MGRWVVAHRSLPLVTHPFRHSPFAIHASSWPQTSFIQMSEPGPAPSAPSAGSATSWPSDAPPLLSLLFMLLIRLVSCLLIALPTRVVSLPDSFWLLLCRFGGEEGVAVAPLFDSPRRANIMNGNSCIVASFPRSQLQFLLFCFHCCSSTGKCGRPLTCKAH